MSLSIMLRLCLFFLDSEPIYAYKRYAYKKKTCIVFISRSYKNQDNLFFKFK